MSITDVRFSYRNVMERIELSGYDRNGFPYFKGHHPSKGTFTLNYCKSGIWFLSGKEVLPISGRAWRYKPLIPDDMKEMGVLPSIMGLVRKYNNAFENRIVPGTWRNIQLVGEIERKRIMETMKLIVMYGIRNKINIPQEMIYHIFWFLNVLLNDDIYL